MGKAKQKKHARRAVNAPEKPVDHALRQQKVLPCINQLSSPHQNVVLEGLQSALPLVKDDVVRHLLLREKLLHILLNDVLKLFQISVVSLALAVLRAVVDAEGRDAALFLTRRKLGDALAALVTLFREQYSSCSADASAQFLEQLFGLTSSVVDCVPFFSPEVSQLAAELCSPNGAQLPTRVYAEALRMLYLLSADSSEVAFDARSFESLAAAESPELGVYLLGLKFNQCLAGMGDTEAAGAQLRGIVEQLVTKLSSLAGASAGEPTPELTTCLEILAIALQTDDVQLLSFAKRSILEPVYHLLETRAYLLESISVLNNIGWSLNQLQQAWLTEAALVARRLFETCFKETSSEREVSAGLGLLAACIAQNEAVAQEVDFGRFAQALTTSIRELQADASRPTSNAWVELGCALLNVLNVNPALMYRLGLLTSGHQLIDHILTHSHDPEAEIVALNSLFELFGDNEAEYNDAEYNQSGLRERVESLKPLLKRSLKSATDNKEQAREALLNLENFVKYKRE